MTINNISDIVFKLYLYADLTKKIHYTTDTNNIHELCDKVRDDIMSFADDLAEQSFGYYGKPSYSELPKITGLEISESDDIAEICKRVSDMVDSVRSDVSKVDALSGTVSLIDDFKGKMNKDVFLASFDKISTYKNK
ncbi:MAG: hypothetical protein J6Y37_14450 [Paludibacteraceae bacterium]|nr:hypothetical protein [Paludibacteraceae bacterium]